MVNYAVAFVDLPADGAARCFNRIVLAQNVLVEWTVFTWIVVAQANRIILSPYQPK